MGAIEIRQLAEGESAAFARSVSIPFLDFKTDEELEQPRWQRVRRALEFDRSWVAVDSGRFVGNCTIYSMDLTVPSAPGAPCPVVPMGGVSAVGVHPTHRRRGILNSLMTEMLVDCSRRGEPVAGLIASESVIYGRYGFGLATQSATVTIDTTRATMVVPAPGIDLQLMGTAEAAKVVPALFERLRPLRAGESSMSETAWESLFADDEEERNGVSNLVFAVAEDGYVAYRAKFGLRSDDYGTLQVVGLWGADAGVEAALWRYLCDVDLVNCVVARRRPLDDPLRWRLADPRQLHFDDVIDRLHLRILDVPAAFSARGYSGSGRLVLEVTPPAAGSFPGDRVPGLWELSVSSSGDGSVAPASASAAVDLRLDVTSLGTLYMGGFAASLLGAAGRISEVTPGALARADALLLTQPSPHTVVGF